MSRLPAIVDPNCEPDLVGSYISDHEDLKREVEEREAAKKLAVRQLNDLRKRYAKEKGLFTPGVDHALKLLEKMTPESAREWLRGFDVARVVTDLDKVLGQQGEMFDKHDRGLRGKDLAEAAA